MPRCRPELPQGRQDLPQGHRPRARRACGLLQPRGNSRQLGTSRGGGAALPPGRGATPGGLGEVGRQHRVRFQHAATAGVRRGGQAWVVERRGPQDPLEGCAPCDGQRDGAPDAGGGAGRLASGLGVGPTLGCGSQGGGHALRAGCAAGPCSSAEAEAEAVVRAEAEAKASAVAATMEAAEAEAEAVVRAEAEAKASAMADALLAEEAAEAAAAETSAGKAPGKGKAKGKATKGKGSRCSRKR